MREDLQPANGEPSKHRSAIITLPDVKNAAGADIPAPLAAVVRRAGTEYRQYFREGRIAIYLARGPGARVEYEVCQVQVYSAGDLSGRLYPAREVLPANGDWGKLGFTFSTNSHRDPLAAALAKARTLLGETERGSESDHEQG